MTFESFLWDLGSGFVCICYAYRHSVPSTEHFLSDDAEDSSDIRYCLFLLLLLLLLFSSHGRNVGLSNDEWPCPTNFGGTPERRDGEKKLLFFRPFRMWVFLAFPFFPHNFSSF